MTSNPLVMLFSLLSLWHIADASTQEAFELRVFDRDVQISNDKMMELLREADLESHGYKKEIITQRVSDSGNGKPIYEKRYQFFKTIECSRLREIDRELNKLIPGVLGIDVVSRINKEIQTKHLDAMRQCKAGLEVHLKKAGNCSSDSKASNRRRKRAAGCTANWCLICWWSKLT